MSNKDTISLLGCGWLGFPLATRLISEGSHVRASTTSAAKLEVFKQAGIDPYLVQFSADGQFSELRKLFESETLIITIPPGRRDPSGFFNYQQMVKEVCNHLPGSKVARIIFISSTSVYPDCNAILDESSDVLPDTTSGKLIAETEALLSKQKVNLIVLRLSGLIGPGRMPGRFFAGKENIPNGLAPVNLVHLEDVIGIIRRLLSDHDATGIYNISAPSHPERAEFYTLAAKKEGLREPKFILEKERWKIVASRRVEKELNYEFRFPSLMDWIASRSGG